MNVKKAIVTGANGFIGGAVVRELLENEYEVFAVVRRRDAVLPDHKQLHKIICAQEQIEKISTITPQLEGADFYHFAWAGSAKFEDRTSYEVQLNQVKNTLHTLEAAANLKCKQFICSGSIMEQEVIANLEQDGTSPSMSYVYGGGKLVAHAMAQSLAVKVGINLIWTQITNAYGAGEKSQRMVNTTLQKCMDGIEPQFTAGTQNYDFVYIDDVARAFRLIGEKGLPASTYLIGSSHPRPLKEFLLEMQSAVAPDLAFHFGDIPFRGVNLPLAIFDGSKLEKDTGFRAEISFGDGCQKTIAWLKNNH